MLSLWHAKELVFEMAVLTICSVFHIASMIKDAFYWLDQCLAFHMQLVHNPVLSAQKRKLSSGYLKN